ncbi:MAG: GntR family transcriptional regulator [Gordonia sp. (in: high G+C Gram-positive bacteria)]
MGDKRRNDPEALVEALTDIWCESAARSVAMPSEPQLAAAMGASRPAVREALTRLEERGYVHRSQGARTVINRSLIDIGTRVDQQRDHMIAIERAGYQASVSVLEAEVTVIDAQRSFHTLAVGTRVLRTRKVWCADGEPYVLAEDLIPISDESLVSVADINCELSVFDLAEEFNGVSVAWETVWLSAVAIDDSERIALGRNDVVPALQLIYMGEGAEGETAYWCREIQLDPPVGLRNALVRRVSRS